jgi:hypothetical protein
MLLIGQVLYDNDPRYQGRKVEVVRVEERQVICKCGPREVASHARLAALAMARSVIQTRPSGPCRASMAATIVCKVRESWVLPANTS